MQSGEHAPLPNSPERAATSALRTWCLRVGDRLPFLKSVGFALWIGWFGVAYSTTAWVSDDASTVSALGIMFTTSTISHMVGLVAFALAASLQSGRLLSARDLLQESAASSSRFHPPTTGHRCLSASSLSAAPLRDSARLLSASIAVSCSAS